MKIKRSHRRLLSIILSVTLGAPPTSIARAEDIDLFVSAAATVATNPNILIILDNSANWNSAAQHWPTPAGETGVFKQGESELRAINTVVNELDGSNPKVNLGLMMLRKGPPDSAFLRYAIRPMNTTNKNALVELIGAPTGCSGTNSLNGTPNCILQNFSGTGVEQTSSAATDYSAAMLEAYKYFGGFTSPAFAQKDQQPPGAINDRTHHKQDIYWVNDASSRIDREAYTDSSFTTYRNPITSACAKNYVIFIGNGFPSQDPTGPLIANVNGGASPLLPAQLAVPNFTTTSETTNTIIGTACGSGGNENNRRDDCTANIPQSLKDANPAETYACVGPQSIDVIACLGGNNRKFDVQATKTVITVTPLTTFTTPTQVNYADEWAQFLNATDVSELPGQQNVTTFTIDVFKDHQDADETALLFNMAKYGGGKYFAATNEQAIINALRQIMIEIQSVNSVFASASLPLSTTNRAQNENQVFIGMFRPDNSANPRWYGNLKRYQIAQFGLEFQLGDASTPPLEVVSTTTGFVQPCAKSFWTVDSSDYWLFQNGSAGQCTTSGTNIFSDSPDGPQVEKGAAAEVLRRGNNPPTVAGALTGTVNRNLYTCVNSTSCCATPASCGASPATEIVSFNATNVSKTQLGSAAMSDLERDNIINFTTGQDIFDNNTNANANDVRPSIHGDVAHSRPIAVNYGGATGVVLFYGANDGVLRAVRGSDGKELWAFIAPEHHAKLKRLTDNSPAILYPGQDPAPVGAMAKDYFFDGSAGLFQNADNSRVWLYPSMRRGGRMIYSFDVTDPTVPLLKWKAGCTNADLTDTASCTPGFSQMGQTWSLPSVALVKGHSSDVNQPVVIVGGGYDTCDDQDAAPNTACSSRKGNRVYVIDGPTGTLLREFATTGSVVGDLTLLDRDFDGFVDQAYVADSSGGIYRIDFVDPANPGTTRAKADWTITEIARTSGGNRKFLFAPAALAGSGEVFLALTSGDRERPLITNYPFKTPVTNRAYQLSDKFETTTDPATGTVTGSVLNLDDISLMQDFTNGSDCTTASPEANNKRGWFFDLNTGTGEQGVTSSLIFGGLIFFSTNRPIPTPPGACANNLGEARGYAVNLLNASGAVGTAGLCGGSRSGIFVGGGLPPSPVTGVVTVGGKPVTVMIGGIQRSTGLGSAIEGQQIKPTVTQRRTRMYWYSHDDK